MLHYFSDCALWSAFFRSRKCFRPVSDINVRGVPLFLQTHCASVETGRADLQTRRASAHSAGQNGDAGRYLRGFWALPQCFSGSGGEAAKKSPHSLPAARTPCVCVKARCDVTVCGALCSPVPCDMSFQDSGMSVCSGRCCCIRRSSLLWKSPCGRMPSSALRGCGRTCRE